MSSAELDPTGEEGGTGDVHVTIGPSLSTSLSSGHGSDQFNNSASDVCMYPPPPHIGRHSSGHGSDQCNSAASDVCMYSPPSHIGRHSSGHGSDQFNNAASDVFRSPWWNRITNKFGTSFGNLSGITEGKDFFKKFEIYEIYVEIYVNGFN